MGTDDGRTERRPRVIFSYDEEAAQVALEYDAEANRVEVRAGYHGYARLTKLFELYASLPDSKSGEHVHIEVVSATASEFIVTFHSAV